MADVSVEFSDFSESPISDHLERVGAIGYDEFFTKYLQTNRLCIFSSELTKQWRSRKEWVINGKPNLEFLCEMFGNATAPVADCGKKYFSSQPKQDMKVADFLEYWKSKDNQDPRCLYLKDWHFCKDYPEYKAYECPIYFKSDWLNEFWDQRHDVSDDYRFVYMGPKGSWTPFHADVFRSYSWSANVCGCKKWIIYPPGNEIFLYDKLGNLAYNVSSSEICDRESYPNASKAQKPIVIIQREGEVIFVPSGWHHQVHNMEDTISINHNWSTANGLQYMWNHIQSELKKVQQCIQDCREMDNWHQHCQLMLKASSGINYEDLIQFLSTIAAPRIHCIEIVLKNSNRLTAGKSTIHLSSEIQCLTALSIVFKEWSRSMLQHESKEMLKFVDYCRFEISKISNCLSEIKKDNNFIDLKSETLHVNIDRLITQIRSVLIFAKDILPPLPSVMV